MERIEGNQAVQYISTTYFKLWISLKLARNSQKKSTGILMGDTWEEIYNENSTNLNSSKTVGLNKSQHLDDRILSYRLPHLSP